MRRIRPPIAAAVLINVAWASFAVAQEPTSARERSPALDSQGVAVPRLTADLHQGLETFVEPVSTALLSSFDPKNAGLFAGAQPEVLTWDKIYALVRVRARRGAFLPTLDPAAVTADSVRHGVADFARFRTNFHGNGPFHDPGPSVLELERQLLAIDTARQNLRDHESLNKLLVERSQGTTSGANRLDVDIALASSLRARQRLADEISQYRDGLDQLKFTLGLSPRAPVVPDRDNLETFTVVFDSVENWMRNENRQAQPLAEIIARLPPPGEVVVNGEPILGTIDKNPDQWESILANASQRALDSRRQRDEIPTQPNSGVQLELRIRSRIRSLHHSRQAYEVEKRLYELAIRLRDQAFERLLAPLSAPVASRASLIKELLDQLVQTSETRDRIVGRWTSFRADRLLLYHDLGVLPAANWQDFYADLSARPIPPAALPSAHPR
jgi:hypothetical protein